MRKQNKQKHLITGRTYAALAKIASAWSDAHWNLVSSTTLSTFHYNFLLNSVHLRKLISFLVLTPLLGIF